MLCVCCVCVCVMCVVCVCVVCVCVCVCVCVIINLQSFSDGVIIPNINYWWPEFLSLIGTHKFEWIGLK